MHRTATEGQVCLCQEGFAADTVQARVGALVKVAGFGKGVNVTLGLPFPRTAPDHGTALDIAGKDIADPGSMRAALELAVELAGRARRG